MPCLFFKASTIKMARVVEKVIVGGRSHVDYDGFVHHSCYHFGALGDVTVILLFFGPPLSTVRGVARVIAKVIVGGRSYVDYDGFVHHSCYHFGALGDVTVILLFFGPPLSTVMGVARVIANVIVGGRSHVDYDGFFHHGCCHFGAWGDVTVILLFFGPPLSTVRGLARVIAKVIVGGRSHVDCDGFVHHGCRRPWTPLLPILPRYRCAYSFGPLHRRTPRLCLCTISFFLSQEPYFVFGFFSLSL